MPLGPMPPANPAGAPSPREHFANYVNSNGFIPMWLHPDVAQGVLRHFGRDGRAVIHPHPTTTGYVSGGVVNTPFPIVGGGGTPAAQLGGGPVLGQPPHMGGAAGFPAMAGAFGTPAAAGQALGGIRGGARQSIFGGGTVGAAGPADRTPVFVQNGGTLDGTDGGQVPGVDMGEDTVPAMLQPGEAVFNKNQLAGIKPKPGKEHLLRSDQKKAMRKAGRRYAPRK